MDVLDHQVSRLAGPHDRAAVEARLWPQLGKSLCVVPSRWTTGQLDGVRDHLHKRWQSRKLYQLGPQHAEDGQARITARLVQVLPEIAAWTASLPSGIVALQPWARAAWSLRSVTMWLQIAMICAAATSPVRSLV